MRIVTLNMGLGRDSLAMLALLIEGQLVVEDRALRPNDIDAVVFSGPDFKRARRASSLASAPLPHALAAPPGRTIARPDVGLIP